MSKFINELPERGGFITKERAVQELEIILQRISEAGAIDSEPSEIGSLIGQIHALEEDNSERLWKIIEVAQQIEARRQDYH